MLLQSDKINNKYIGNVDTVYFDFKNINFSNMKYKYTLYGRASVGIT